MLRFCGNLLLLYPSKLALAFATAFFAAVFPPFCPSQPSPTAHKVQHRPQPRKKSPNHKKLPHQSHPPIDSFSLVILLSHTAPAPIREQQKTRDEAFGLYCTLPQPKPFSTLHCYFFPFLSFYCMFQSQIVANLSLFFFPHYAGPNGTKSVPKICCLHRRTTSC